MHRPSREFTRRWSLRLSLVGAGMAFGAIMPLIGPADERLFLALHKLGDGPVALRRARPAHAQLHPGGLAASIVAACSGRRLALVVAWSLSCSGLFSDMLVQLVYLVLRPPAARGDPGRPGHAPPRAHNWAQIASFPSGHLVVTTAMAVAAMALVPALRGPLWAYVGLIALTRITFGAHFPMDVLVGGAFGYVVGRFAAGFPTRWARCAERWRGRFRWPSTCLARAPAARGGR